MSSAEFHWLCGKYVRERETALGIGKKSLLGAAYECGVPIYTSSPGDSSIGMNVAALALDGNKCVIDPNADVNETASIVLGAKRGGGRSAIVILGGGSPKNFALQTEPQIQEVLGIDEKGHDYFLQITDARPDTGGLSGATPAEAVSWGKIDPDRLPDAVVCYLDSTVALPLLTSYALAKRKPRKLRRLYDQRDKLMNALKREYARSKCERCRTASSFVWLGKLGPRGRRDAGGNRLGWKLSSAQCKITAFATHVPISRNLVAMSAWRLGTSVSPWSVFADPISGYSPYGIQMFLTWTASRRNSRPSASVIVQPVARAQGTTCASCSTPTPARSSSRPRRIPQYHIASTSSCSARTFASASRAPVTMFTTPPGRSDVSKTW